MRISITAISDYQRCPRLYRFKHVDRLRPVDGEVPGYLLIGRAFSKAMEVASMTREPGATRRRAALATAIKDLEDPSLHDKMAQVIGAVPTFVWDVELPMAEDRLATVLTQAEPWGKWEMVGKPDLWWVEDGVRMVEFKTTSKTGAGAMQKMVEYQTWGQQRPSYAWLLRQEYPWLRDMLFFHQYILLTYEGRSYQGGWTPVRVEQMDEAGGEMERWGWRAYRDPDFPHTFGPQCQWCEFAPACQAYLTGADEGGILAEQFRGAVQGVGKNA